MRFDYLPAGRPEDDEDQSLPTAPPLPPPAAAPPPAPIMPAPAEPAALPQDLPPAEPLVRSTTNTSTTSRRTIVPREEKQILGQMERDFAAQEQIAKRIGEHQTAMAGIKAKQAEDAAEFQATLTAQRANEAAAQDREIQARTAAANAEYDKWRAMGNRGGGFKDYFADKGTGDKVVAGLAIAFGALGSALAGGPNRGLEAISRIVEQDFEKQKAAAEKQRQVFEDRKGAVGEAKVGKRDALQALELKQAAFWDSLDKLWTAQLLKANVPAEQLTADANLLKIREEKNALLKKHYEGIRTDVSTTTNRQSIEMDPRMARGGAAGARPMGVEQGKAWALAQRMAQDFSTLKSVPPMSEEGRKRMQQLAGLEEFYEKHPKLKLAAIQSGRYRTPAQVLNENDKTAYYAGQRLAAASLRGDSGASISAKEYMDWSTQRLPQPGDSARDIEAKNQATEREIRAKAEASGRPAEVMQLMQRPAAAASAPPGTRQVQIRLKSTGQLVSAMQYPDGRVVPVQ